MKIDNGLIGYLENLSRLKLDDKEREQAKSDLTSVIGYMAKLGEVDTKDMPAISHPFSVTNQFREDKAAPSCDRERILANAAVKTAEYFKAPKTVE